MPKKIIVKKLSNTDNLTEKAKTTKKLSKEKLQKIKQTAPDNVPQMEYLKQQKEMLSNALQSIQDVEKIQGKMDVLRIKYRTKYMELEHFRKISRERVDKLLDIISDLKSELIKFAPDDILLDVQKRITEITNENNVGRKKAL